MVGHCRVGGGVGTLSILGRSKEPLPPQGVYNAGQKLFGLAVYAIIPVVMLRGLVMTFGWPSPAAVSWAVPVHFTAVGLMVSGVMIHVYMAAVFPEEKPAFFSMITGSVDELYPYSHHFKWWREEKEKQLARRGSARPRWRRRTPPPLIRQTRRTPTNWEEIRRKTPIRVGQGG
jgi:cytochrome b subunit of formate dehydrogenase